MNKFITCIFQGLYKWTNGDSYTGDWRDGVPQVRQKIFRISSTCTFVVCCHFPFIPNYSYIGLLPFKLWDVAKVTAIVIVTAIVAITVLTMVASINKDVSIVSK